jgi:hypothetical protein
MPAFVVLMVKGSTHSAHLASGRSTALGGQFTQLERCVTFRFAHNSYGEGRGESGIGRRSQLSNPYLSLLSVDRSYEGFNLSRTAISKLPQHSKSVKDFVGPTPDLPIEPS